MSVRSDEDVIFSVQRFVIDLLSPVFFGLRRNILIIIDAINFSLALRLLITSA